MTTPPTNAVSSVLLIDQRIEGYETIVSSAKPDTRCVVFDTTQVDVACKQESITSFQYMANRIADLELSSFVNIGIVQHNFNTPYSQFFGVNPSELSTVASVETADPTLQTWAGVASFITGLKTTYGVQNLDLMACALYSNPDWKYIIDTLAAQVNITIRASTDDTGAAELGGNWFLESHTGVNLKNIYFTDSIDSFSGLLDMGMGVFQPSQGGWMSMITPPSTLAVWGNSLTTTVLPTSLSSKLVNITKVFSYGVFSNHSYLFALNTNGVLYGFGTKSFGGLTSEIINNESNSGWIDYYTQNGLIALLKSNGTVAFLTDGNDSNAYIYYSTFTVSNAIGVYNMVARNNDPNRRFGVLDSSSTLRVYDGPRNITTTSASLSSTITNVARVINGDGFDRLVLRRDRTILDRFSEELSTWTNVAAVFVIKSAIVFGIDTSNNLLYTNLLNGYNYTETPNAPSGSRTNVVSVKLSGTNVYGIGLLLQMNGTVTGWSAINLGSSYSFNNQDYQAIAIYISAGGFVVDPIIQSALSHNGTLYIRGGRGTNTYSNVIDVVSGYMFIAFLLNNGNVILHTSSNTFVTVVNTNNAVGLYIFGQNELNVVLNDGSLVRYYNGSITYDTSVVYYNGSTTQSSTILNSNVKGAVATIGLQAAAIQTSSSLASLTKFDLFQYFKSRNNRRISDFTSLNGTYTINDYRTITLIDPFLPTTNTYTLLIPDYQSSANLVSSPYNIKSNITIGASVQNFIVAIEEGEQFTINGDTSATYVMHHPYIYSVTTSPTFALTRVSTISTAGNGYTIYGDGGFSGIAIPAPTLSNFGPFTIANDRAFTLPTPTSNLATVYGSTWSQVGSTLTGSGSYASLGQSVSMSKDGTTVIVGAPQNTNPTRGYVGVYKNISGTWTLLGSLIFGDSQSDHFGESVAISADGTIIAVGATQHNGFNAVGSGYVKVFKIINSAWVQQGANITGGGFDFRNGSSVSLSANGKIVAVGEHMYNLVASSFGRVRVFIYDESNTSVAPIGWTQLGGDIHGISGYWFGINVSLSSDGYTIAISGPLTNTSSSTTGGGGGGGLVRIFQYSSSKVSNITDVSSANFGPVGWNRLGGDFYGLASSQAGGFRGLNLSSDGTVVAIGYGTYSNRGLARVFKYSASKSTNITNENDANYGPIGWYRLGQDLTAAVSEDSFGVSVSLSNDGTVVSVGGLYIDSNSPLNNDNVGGVKSYSFSSSSNTWSSIGQTLYGVSSWEYYGFSLSSSGSGTVLAVGASNGNLNGTSSGYVKIYNIDVSGGFTYSSENTSVAEVYSSVVLPKSNGQVVVRAEQAGYGGYINKTISANLTIQASAPTYTYTVLKPQSITKTFGVDVSFSLSDVLTGVSNSNGAYTFASTSGAVSISGNVATILAYTVSAITITATQAASGNYGSGSTEIYLLVNRGTPSYGPISQITKTYLTDVSFSLASVVAGISNSSGNYTFTNLSPAISISGDIVTILSASDSTINILASQDASGNYNASSTTIPLVINRATPTFESVAQISKTILTDVSFSLAPIVAGMSNSNGAYVFTAAVNANGYISISGDVVTILAYTPTAVDINVYQEASGNFTLKNGTLSLLVSQKVPSYGAFSPGTKVFGAEPYSIVPPTTDNSGTAITYQSSTPSVATISSDGTVVTIVGHGSTTITASQVAGGNFLQGSTTGILTVNRAAPTILKTFTIPDKTFGDSPFSLLDFTDGLDNTDGTYSFSSSNPSIVSISNVDNVTATILGYTPSSPVVITVNIDACGNYAAATTDGTLTVNRANPTYQSVSQVSKTFGVDASFSLTAVMAGISNSDGAYTFASSSAAVVVSGNVASIAAYTPSAITITATQAASGNYNGGTKTFTVLVARGSPTYQSVSQVSKTFGVDASFSLTAVMAGISNSDGAYTFASSSAAVVVSGDVASIAAYTPSAITITATQDASGNYNSGTKTFTVLVARGSPTYQSVSQVSKTFGVDASFSLTAVMAGISNSDGAYTFASSSAAVVVSGGVASIAAYTPSAITITATQDASGNYNSGTKTFTVLVARGSPGLSNFNNLTRTYGSGNFEISHPTTNSSGAFIYSSSHVNVATISYGITSLFSITNPSIPTLSLTNFPPLGSLSKWEMNIRFNTTIGNRWRGLIGDMFNSVNPNRGWGIWISETNSITFSWQNITWDLTPAVINVLTNRDYVLKVSKTPSSLVLLLTDLTTNGTQTATNTAMSNTSVYVMSTNGPVTIGGWIQKTNENFTGTIQYVNVNDANNSPPTISIVGPGTTTITATQDASGNYEGDSISAILTVFNPTPTYQTISQINKTYGTDISFSLSDIMVGVSNSDGTYTFSSNSTSISINGDVATILAYTPSAISITALQEGSGNYISGSTTIPLFVNRATPTYQSVSQITKTYGVDVSFSLASIVAGISNSDGNYSLFSSTSSAISIENDVVTILEYTPSAITITASQDASGNYASSSKDISLLVNRGPATYQPISQITKIYGTDASFSLTPYMVGVSNSSGAYTFSSTSAKISISGDIVSVLAYSSDAITISAVQEASGNYIQGATSFELLINRKVPDYSAFSLPSVVYEQAPYSLVDLNLVPTSESDATYVYTSSHPSVATISSDGTVVTIVGQGTTTITVSQDPSGNYASGSTSASLFVARAAPSILQPFTLPSKTYGDVSFSLLPYTVGLDNTDGAYTFTSSNPAVVSIDGDYATILAYSETPVSIYVAIDVCGNYSSGQTSGTLTINRATPTYLSVSAVNKTYGDEPFSLVPYMSGISNSNGSYTFASSNPSVVEIDADGVTASILAYSSSAITITATQAVSGNYGTGTKTFELILSRAAPTIGALSLGPLNGYYDVSDVYFTLTAPTSNSLGQFVYSSDNTSVAAISTPSFLTTNLIARYDVSNPANYLVENGYITYISDLTGNNRRLNRTVTGTNVITVGSNLSMVNFTTNLAGFYANSIPLTSTNTFFMAVHYNPNNITIPVNGSFYHHGSVDIHLAILMNGGSNRAVLRSNNDNSAGITLTPNTRYIFVSRVSDTTREFWAYSEDGTYGYASANNSTVPNITTSMFIGQSNVNISCSSYIGEIMYYNRSLSSGDIDNNVDYLKTKWLGITSSTKVVRLLSNGEANIIATQDICGNYSSGSVSRLLRVGATVPEFGTFTVSSTPKTYGDGQFTLVPPTSNSDGLMTFSSSNPDIISISGTTATIQNAGSVYIYVSQDPSGSFTRKTISSSLFTVQKKNPNLRNFPSITKSLADGSFIVSPPETDGPGSFTYSSGKATVISNSNASPNFTIVAGGTDTISAFQEETQNYLGRVISTSVLITPILPDASYNNFTRAYDVGSFTAPLPTTNSGGTITYSSNNPSVASISDNTIIINKVGEAVITATIGSTASYLTRDISAVFVVTRGTPLIGGLLNQTRTMVQEPFTLSPTSSSDGTFSYVSDNSAVVFMTNNGTTFNVASVGFANISATITEDTSGNYNPRTVSFSIEVVRATSNLKSRTFTVPGTMVYGDQPVNTIAFPTSNSTGNIVYTSSNTNVATIHPTTGVISAVAAGWAYFIATQAETSVYNLNTLFSNSMQVFSKTITQSPAAPYTSGTITKYYGDASFSLATVSESFASKIFSTNVGGIVSLNTVSSTGVITIVNVGDVIVSVQQLSNTQYNVSNIVYWNIKVEKGNTALTGLSPTISKNVTDVPFTLSVGSASMGTKSYQLSNLDNSNVLIVHPTTGLVTLKGAGQATVIVSQAASSLYNAPTDVSCVITVAEAGSSLQGSTLNNTRIFDSVNMNGALLAGTTVSGSSFAGASLVNAVLNNATVSNATMTSVNMENASMTNAVVSGTTFAGATMTNVAMSGAAIRNSTMTTVNMSGATMSNVDISGSTFAGATMTSVAMSGATIRNSTMTTVNMTGATMSNATITGTTFANSTMTNAILTDATLTNSTLTSTVLTGASLLRANVSGSNFVGATLANADLSGATVTNANFTNANISGANITNVAFSPLQKLQLLKNTNNRAIGGIQVSDVSGSTILSAISETSPAVSIPNIASATIKVVIPHTSTDPTVSLANVNLDTVSNDKFYFPINDGEYFQILGVKYYTSEGAVKNYATDEAVEVISYGSKSIWLMAGSIIANVLDVNTISQSTFTVASKKLDTDGPFNITVAPTSNSDAPIVYSSNNTSVATIHPTTGVITIVGQGYVNFIATQAPTLMYEGGSKKSNELFVNTLINFTLSGLNQMILMSTNGLLDASAVPLETTDATAVFYVKLSDMTNVFKIQTDSYDMNDTDASDVKYYVFHRKWPTELKINPAHAMMNKTESDGMLGSSEMFAANKMLAKHDFLRYLAFKLFNTIHGVDLFSNESDLLENTAYWGEDVNANIHSILSSISTTSSDTSMNYDVSGNKYLTNANSDNTNLCRELVRQLTANAASRFGTIVDANTPQGIPLMEDDSINFKVTFQAAPSQNLLTGVTEIPSRSYMIKLILKNSISELNTAVADSEMYPNGYPYSSSVTTYAPTSASSAVYNVYSPPAPIPFARFGFDGWYYTNSSAWVTSASRNHIKWLLPANSGSTVGSLRYIRANLKIHNKTSMPFVVVYTQNGSWRKYPVANNSSVVNGTAYSFYVNFNTYTSEPAIIGYTNMGLTSSLGVGSFSSFENILNIALETESGAAAGAVEFTLASMIVGYDNIEKEYGFEADVPTSYP